MEFAIEDSESQTFLMANKTRLQYLIAQVKELESARSATLRQIEKTETMLKTCTRRHFALTLIQVRNLDGAKRRVRLNATLEVLKAAQEDSRVDNDEHSKIDAFAVYVAKMNDASEDCECELLELSENLEKTAVRLRLSLKRRKLNLEYLQATLVPRVVRALEHHNAVMIKAYDRSARSMRIGSFMIATCSDTRDEEWLQHWLDCCGFEDETTKIGIVIDPGSMNESESEILVPPVAFAAFSENLDALRLLLKRGADVNDKSACGRTPMYLASARGNVKCMELLIAMGGEVSLSDALDGTPLHRAVRNNKLEAAKWLVAHGAEDDVRKPNYLGHHTPLHVACMNDSSDNQASFYTVKWLLSTAACKDVYASREQYIHNNIHNTDIVSRFFSRASSGRPCALALAAENFDVAELLVLHYSAWSDVATGHVDALMVHSDLQSWNQAEVRERSASFRSYLMVKHYTIIEQFAAFLRCIVAGKHKQPLWKLFHLDHATSTGIKMKIAEYAGLSFGRRLRVLHGVLKAIDEVVDNESEEESSDDSNSDEEDDSDDDEDEDEEGIDEEVDEDSIGDIFL
jgi:hypothetical protein